MQKAINNTHAGKTLPIAKLILEIAQGSVPASVLEPEVAMQITAELLSLKGVFLYDNSEIGEALAVVLFEEVQVGRREHAAPYLLSLLENALQIVEQMIANQAEVSEYFAGEIDLAMRCLDSLPS